MFCSDFRGVFAAKILDSEHICRLSIPELEPSLTLSGSDPPIPQVVFYQSGIGSEGNWYSFLQGMCGY